MKLPHRPFLSRVASARPLLLAASLGLAAGLPALPGATGPGDDAAEALRLEPFTVTGVPVERSVNPLTRPLEGVFGDARGILDTPRAASTITQALLRERGIEGVREFVAYAPGSYAPASYGKATIPNIRGDLAETFLNGQRLSYNNFGYFPSFNNVEAVDVVRGPGSALYGSGFFTGGYVNYVTKQPKFIRETTVTARLGTWVPGGGSWLHGSWQVDTTAPFADGRSAWRLSYEGKEDDTFFRRHGGRDDRQDVFVSWLRRASDTLTLEANAQYLWQSNPQLLGVNRPNQELIDSGRYYTGDLPDLGYSPAGALAGTIPGTAWVDLPRDATLLSVGDFSNANVYRAQFIATARLAGGARLVNRTLAEHVNRRRYHAFEYAEWAKQTTVEHRLEWHADLEAGGLAHALIAGATVRWEDRLSYTNYFNEYFFQYDLTRSNRVFSHAADYPNSYFPGFAGPGGREFFPASYGSPETTDSTLWNPALFLQDEVRLSERWSLLAGLRADAFSARARDPLGQASGIDWHDRHDDRALSGNASLLHRLSPRATLYATYQRAYAVHGNVTGGGIMLKDDGAGNGIIDPDDFKNLSRLAELGAKFSLLDHKLYAGVALYDQRRAEVELGGDIKNLKMRGAELELVYQPDLSFNATFNVAYTDGRFDHSSASQAGGTSLYNLYAAGRGPGGLGNGLGFQWDKLPPGDYRIPGLSRWVVNGSFAYTAPSGFGGGLGGSWQGEQPGNLTNEYHIPAQIFLNAFVFYRRPSWEANIDIVNALDRRNWIHNGDNYSNHVLVFQDLPLRVEGQVKFRF
ncbi:MAG: TonB-dependent receptor [Opitutaceae bacterium]|nr:TonB-dependent receptor [Opitutaceae bacterium]